MGQLNSDSSLCKWHLNAGKQLTNKRAATRLQLTDTLRHSVQAMSLSRFYLKSNKHEYQNEHQEVTNELFGGWGRLCVLLGSRGAFSHRRRTAPASEPPTSPSSLLSIQAVLRLTFPPSAYVQVSYLNPKSQFFWVRLKG